MGIGKVQEIGKSCQFRDKDARVLQAVEEHLQIAQHVNELSIRKGSEKRPEEDLRRVPHGVQYEVDEHAPCEGDEPDVLCIEGERGQ